MFKVGDIVKVEPRYIADDPKYRQSWKITHLYKNMLGKFFVSLQNLKQNDIMSIHEDNLVLDKNYNRRLKLEKICSKLVM